MFLYYKYSEQTLSSRWINKYKNIYLFYMHAGYTLGTTHEEIKFNIGDKVVILFDVPTKGPLMPRWEGPFTIIEKVNPATYKVENDEKIITIHVQRIKLANNVYNM